MLVKLDHIEKNYVGFRLRCSLELPEGRVTALVGPNGSGKSTTFKLILGLIFADSGYAEVFGKPADRLTKEEKAELGVVLSDSGFSGYLTVKDVTAILQRMYPTFDRGWFTEKCRQFSLPDHKKIKEFSTGMRAKLKVLAAISHETRLLILDEPTAGLDVLARTEIMDMLREYMLPGNRSILISSHISGDLEGLCDDFYLIHQGEILLHEDISVLLDEYGILKVSPEQYRTLDKAYLLKKQQKTYGFDILTNRKQFYQENEPQLAIEKGTIDEMIAVMIKGESI